RRWGGGGWAGRGGWAGAAPLVRALVGLVPRQRGPPGGRGGPPVPPPPTDGGGELVLDELDLAAHRFGVPLVAETLRFVEQRAQLLDAAPVGASGVSVEERPGVTADRGHGALGGGDACR